MLRKTKIAVAIIATLAVSTVTANELVKTDVNGTPVTGTVQTLDVQGKVVKTVHTYGVGEMPTASSVITYKSASIGDEYAAVDSSGIAVVDFDKASLLKMKVGETKSFKFFDKDVKVAYSDTINHSNGDSSWVGNVDGDGRVIITFGTDGSVFGSVTDADGGNYSIETASDGNTMLIDNGAPGREAPSQEHDMVAPHSDGTMLGAAAAQTATTATTTLNNTLATTGTTAVPATVMDVMVLYSSTLPNAATRVNNLVATTNQAYKDSGLTNVSIRLVNSYGVTYPDANANTSALTTMASNSGVFKDVNANRAKYGADAVIYLRPLKATAQGSCGVAYANGANGTLLQASKAYAEVSDGTDGQYFCYNTTLAHELGHIMGAVHDKEHSVGIKGVYADSYGYGINNLYGDIMSYYSPQIAKFADPTTVAMTTAKGAKYYLGVDGVANIVKTFKATAPVVANFVPTTIK